MAFLNLLITEQRLLKSGQELRKDIADLIRKGISKLLLVISVFTVFAIVKVDSLQANNVVDNTLAESEWQLSSFASPGSETPLIEGTKITLKFGTDGRAGGSAGCNSYSAAYREDAELLSFSKIISTKRACLDPKANQQEQQFLGALEGVTKFSLSGERLTVFYGKSQDMLNFVKDESARPQAEKSESPSGPVDVLSEFYNAINVQDFQRAYRYWETPPSNFQEFARGYADTASVKIIVMLPVQVEGAAGSLYAEIPTAIIARQRDGSERHYIGCYVLRKSNLNPSDIPKEEAWRVYRAKVMSMTATASVPKIAGPGMPKSIARGSELHLIDLSLCGFKFKL